MELTKHLLYIIIGAVVGVTMRYMIGYYAVTFVKEGYTYWVTMAINILGSFTLGALVAYFLVHKVDKSTELMLTVGFCGTFTTFSTFSIEALTLLRNGLHKEFFLYIGLSIVLGLVAAWLGWKLFYHQ